MPGHPAGGRSYRVQRLLATAAFSIVAQWAMVTAARAQTTVMDAGSQIRAGERIYQARCASCHGARFQGSPFAPPLLRVGAAAIDFWVSTGRMPAIVPPDIQAMHERSQLSGPEIEALIAYVTAATPGGPAIPRVGTGGDPVHGRTLYATHCQACHGAVAQGGSVGYGYIAPPLDRATITQIAEAVRIGPGPMPRFGESSLSQRDLDGLISYINTLVTQPDRRAGFALGNFGPVAEGLVAWVLGIGSLIAIIRFIGTTQ